MARLLVTGGVLASSGTPRGIAADLVIEDGRFAAILTDDTPRPEDADVLHATGCALIPGLVNGHTHAHNNLLKGLGDRWTLEMSLAQAPPLAQHRSFEVIYRSAAIGAAEMLLKGCTGCYDMVFEYPAPTVEGLDAVAQAYDDVGMRAVIAPMVADTAFADAIPGLRHAMAAKGLDTGKPGMACDDILDRLKNQLHHWRWGRDRIRMALGPTIPLLCSDAFLAGCRDLARTYGCGLHTHLCESKVQTVVGLQRYGCSIVEHLDRLKLLTPDLTCAHAVWLSETDRKRIADSGATIVHNPGSNFRLGSGMAQVRAMRDAGIVVGLGTDGATCADSLNMFEAMRLMTHASRSFAEPHHRWLSAQDAFVAATRGSAAALGFGDQIGRIAVGAQADLVVLDLTRPQFVPLNALMSQIVYGEDSSAVRDVLVGGCQVVRNRELTTIDYPALVRRVNDAALDLEGRSVADRDLARKMAQVASTFCHGLMQHDVGMQGYIDAGSCRPGTDAHRC